MKDLGNLSRALMSNPRWQRS